MPRGQRTVTPTDETLPEQAGEAMAEFEVEETEENELDAIELTPEDLYEDTAAVDEDENDVTDAEEDAEVAESAIEVSDEPSVTYKGLRTGGRSPVAITVIVAEDGTQADDPDALIESGETYVLKLDRVTRVLTYEHVEWLAKHPAYLIEKA